MSGAAQKGKGRNATNKKRKMEPSSDEEEDGDWFQEAEEPGSESDSDNDVSESDSEPACALPSLPTMASVLEEAARVEAWRKKCATGKDKPKVLLASGVFKDTGSLACGAALRAKLFALVRDDFRKGLSAFAVITALQAANNQGADGMAKYLRGIKWTALAESTLSLQIPYIAKEFEQFIIKELRCGNEVVTPVVERYRPMAEKARKDAANARNIMFGLNVQSTIAYLTRLAPVSFRNAFTFEILEKGAFRLTQPELKGEGPPEAPLELVYKIDCPYERGKPLQASLENCDGIALRAPILPRTAFSIIGDVPLVLQIPCFTEGYATIAEMLSEFASALPKFPSTILDLCAAYLGMFTFLEPPTNGELPTNIPPFKAPYVPPNRAGTPVYRSILRAAPSTSTSMVLYAHMRSCVPIAVFQEADSEDPSVVEE